MGKKKRKVKSIKSKGRQSKYVYRRNKVFAEVELDCGVTIHLRKMKSTVQQDMINATPVFQQTIAFATTVYQASLADVDLNTLDVPEEMVLPSAEIAALVEFFRKNVVRIEGVEDEDGQALEWDDLSESEQIDFLETLPSVSLLKLYGDYLCRYVVDQDPTLRSSE